MSSLGDGKGASTSCNAEDAFTVGLGTYVTNSASTILLVRLIPRRLPCHFLRPRGGRHGGATKPQVIGETSVVRQGYFVYDSKKAVAVTVSALRSEMLPDPLDYALRSANFVACTSRSSSAASTSRRLAEGGTCSSTRRGHGFPAVSASCLAARARACVPSTRPAWPGDGHGSRITHHAGRFRTATSSPSRRLSRDRGAIGRPTREWDAALKTSRPSTPQSRTCARYLPGNSTAEGRRPRDGGAAAFRQLRGRAEFVTDVPLESSGRGDACRSRHPCDALSDATRSTRSEPGS